MRRKISLYIADHLADLTDESFILFNYTMEDMSNPTIVRNSYSQQITLKGTPNNNRIFGHIWKSDRETEYGMSQAGIYFDPTQKTPFTIYNEMNEILESGYCKLDQISRKSGRVEYKVSLFGGLGAFFYALSYDDQGNRRTLADLKYTGESADEDELNFAITATSVRNAWKRLDGDTSVSALWDILNFAPAYNGLPGGTSDPDKAIVNATVAGLPVPTGHSTFSGWCLATLSRKYTEWEAHDLRSYLQRPVIKMSAILDAIMQPYNNGGYDVAYDSDFFVSTNPYVSKTWLTLPLINSLDVQVTEGSGSLAPAVNSDTVIPGGGVISTNYSINITLVPVIAVAGTADDYYLHCDDASGDYLNYISYKAEALDSSNNIIATREVRLSSFNSVSAGIDLVGTFSRLGEWKGDPVNISITAQGIAKIRLTRIIVATGYGSHPLDEYLAWTNPSDYSSAETISAYSQDFTPGGNTYSYTSSDTARSGVTITKRMLLSGDRTPADYLLSFAKMFGLVFHYDKTTRVVHIMPRENFYQDRVEDLTERISQGEGINMLPYAFDAKWYNFSVPYENGEYAKYYANLYDSIFGIQRVNTGYAFNADQRDLLEGTAFRGACEVLENSKCFVDITDRLTSIPSVFLDGGKYTLYDTTGKTVDFDIPLPGAGAVKTWWNGTDKMYDFISRVQFHDADNAGYEERDTILFFNGLVDITGTTQRISLTDDNEVMMSLNDNTPCWILDSQETFPATQVEDLPRFSRYVWDDGEVTDSLDFGTPAEVAIPDVTFAEGSSIYEQYWQTYIRDRYDDDSRVMVCRVNLAGWQVNEDLFRQFYWYDGSVWALNRIINHSLSTWDDTECEFIKVQDKDSYLD
jgi:hypothetical protein